MNRIFILNDGATVLNVDNDADALRLIQEGARELTAVEIEAAGMVGFEHLVGPHNTTVNAKGKVTFTPPPPPDPLTLEEAQSIKRDELKVLRDSVIAEGFAYGTHTYPLTDDVTQTLLTQFIGSQLMPAPNYGWKDITGIYRDIGDAVAFQAFAMAAMMYGQSVYAREEMLQRYVNVLDSPDAVQAVTWETVPDRPV